MSRFLSFLLSLVIATVIYWAMIRKNSYVFPDNFSHATADLLGRQSAIMTDPIFWAVAIFAYAAIRFVISVQAKDV